MTATGLLGQLPKLDDLEQVRSLIQGGLGAALERVSKDPTSLVEPLNDALGPLSAPAPNLSSLLGPLAGLRGQLVNQLPSGLDQRVAAALPLLTEATRLASSGDLTSVLDNVRANRAPEDLTRDAL